MTSNTESRSDALAQLNLAQQMIEQGRAELLVATNKIEAAQSLIDACAKVLRDNPRSNRPE